jgi:hypothetical protein
MVERYHMAESPAKCISSGAIHVNEGSNENPQLDPPCPLTRPLKSDAHPFICLNVLTAMLDRDIYRRER